jgi:hypothetical protein
MHANACVEHRDYNLISWAWVVKLSFGDNIRVQARLEVKKAVFDLVFRALFFETEFNEGRHKRHSYLYGALVLDKLDGIRLQVKENLLESLLVGIHDIVGPFVLEVACCKS